MLQKLELNKNFDDSENIIMGGDLDCPLNAKSRILLVY